jgi:hypothetical protein
MIEKLISDSLRDVFRENPKRERLWHIGVFFSKSETKREEKHPNMLWRL